jgi:hypothetical protein
MSYRTTSLKSRVRYEGRALTIDRRGDLEVLPDPVWHTVGQVLRQNFRKIVRGSKGGNTTPSGR